MAQCVRGVVCRKWADFPVSVVVVENILVASRREVASTIKMSKKKR